MKQPVVPQSPVHPLLNCLDDFIQTWQRWKEEWAQAKTYEHKAMLIRRGFYVEASEEEAVERLLLYFSLAEGHLTGEGLRAEGENKDRDWNPDHRYPTNSWPFQGHYAKAIDLREALAHSVYAEIVYHFFWPRGDSGNEGYQYPWLKSMKDSRVMDAVLRFFRMENGKMPNYDSRHDGKKTKRQFVKEALVHLCTAKWQLSFWSHDGWEGCRLAENADKFLEILFGLGELEVFMAPRTNRADSKPLVLESADLAKLRELVLAEKIIWVTQGYGIGHYRGVAQGQYRSPKNVEEALTTSSEAAKVYVFLCARQGIDWRP